MKHRNGCGTHSHRWTFNVITSTAKSGLNLQLLSESNTHSPTVKWYHFWETCSCGTLWTHSSQRMALMSLTKFKLYFFLARICWFSILVLARRWNKLPPTRRKNAHHIFSCLSHTDTSWLSLVFIKTSYHFYSDCLASSSFIVHCPNNLDVQAANMF